MLDVLRSYMRGIHIFNPHSILISHVVKIVYMIVRNIRRIYILSQSSPTATRAWEPVKTNSVAVGRWVSRGPWSHAAVQTDTCIS